jgi:hypothetical protein
MAPENSKPNLMPDFECGKLSRFNFIGDSNGDNHSSLFRADRVREALWQITQMKDVHVTEIIRAPPSSNRYQINASVSADEFKKIASVLYP